MRIWFAPLPRPVSDVDLAATFPFDVDVAGDRLRDVLTCPDVEDGVAFDADRVRIQGIWLQSEAPGVRMYAVGEALGERQTFSVDVTFGEELVPAPERPPVPVPTWPYLLVLAALLVVIDVWLRRFEKRTHIDLSMLMPRTSASASASTSTSDASTSTEDVPRAA